MFKQLGLVYRIHQATLARRLHGRESFADSSSD
jgi:hypothetical protein